MTPGEASPAGSAPGKRERPEAGGEGFPREIRIRRGDEIRSLLRRGARHRSAHLDVFVGRGEDGSGGAPRFGTIVPRYGRTVVARNLLKRRLKEVGRREVLPALRRTGVALDVLVRARPVAYEADFPTLRRELLGITEALCSDSWPSG